MNLGCSIFNLQQEELSVSWKLSHINKHVWI